MKGKKTMKHSRVGLVAVLGFGLGLVFGRGAVRSDTDAASRTVNGKPQAEPLPLLGAGPEDDGKLRIICFGAPPGDCELQAGGVAALWAAQGHHVKFVSVTNGDIGHWREAGGPLALRRKTEAEAAAKILGITTEVLEIQDGELLPTVEK